MKALNGMTKTKSLFLQTYPFLYAIDPEFFAI